MERVTDVTEIEGKAGREAGQAARAAALAGLAALALCVLSGGGAKAQTTPQGQSREQAQTAARGAFDQLQQGGDARVLVPQLLAALEQAGLPRTGLVALSVLAQADHAAVRTQARTELFLRAQAGFALAQMLVAQQPGLENDAPAELQAKLARAHLERALADQPPEQGASFASASATAPPETVDPASASSKEELLRARALAAEVPAGSAVAGEAGEVRGLAALAAGDDDAAQREFAALVSPRAEAGPSDGISAARRQRAILQLARLAYARGDDASAIALYAKVSRAAPEWLDALFESSWARFRRGEDEKALGNLLTLHAPFFQGHYFPESYVLKALLLYENCRYADATRTLAEFERSYRPVHDGLAAELARVSTPQLAAELLLQGPHAGTSQIQGPARAEVERLVFAPELVADGRAAEDVAAELDSFDARAPDFRSSALARAVLPGLRAARMELLDQAGRGVRARLASARSELRELLAQSLRLSYEIAGREQELARAGGPALPLSQRAQRSLPQVGEDEELWPFQGEYWRDELGSYQFTLGEHCQRSAPGVPAQIGVTAPTVRAEGSDPGRP